MNFSTNKRQQQLIMNTSLQRKCVPKVQLFLDPTSFVTNRNQWNPFPTVQRGNYCRRRMQKTVPSPPVYWLLKVPSTTPAGGWKRLGNSKLEKFTQNPSHSPGVPKLIVYVPSASVRPLWLFNSRAPREWRRWVVNWIYNQRKHWRTTEFRKCDKSQESSISPGRFQWRPNYAPLRHRDTQPPPPSPPPIVVGGSPTSCASPPSSSISRRPPVPMPFRSHKFPSQSFASQSCREIIKVPPGRELWDLSGSGWHQHQQIDVWILNWNKSNELLHK